MENKILKAIEKFSLLEENSVVTVALSGGADSMCLLYALCALKDKLNITVNAAHLNHMIRGDEALRDENFVKEYCKEKGIELFVKREDIPSLSKKSGESIELCARKCRYDFLKSVSTGIVATAHTASDNLETMLFNLSRGSGLDGLCGIPPKRDIFIRPLILATRQEVEEYCAQNKIPYVTDSTNLCDDYSRNKIRHNIIPVLKELNPNVEMSASNTSDILRQDSLFINETAKKYLCENVSENSLSLGGFKELSVSVQKRVIIGFVKQVNTEISLEKVHIDGILSVCKNGGKTNIPKDMCIKKRNGKLFLLPQKNTDIPEISVKIEEIENDFFENDQKIHNLLLNNLIDCDKIVGKINLRTRIPGDSIRLLNRGCTKQVNKLFTEKGVPQEERDYIPVICDDQGPVWVFGFGVAQRCVVTKNTSRIFKITTFVGK